MTVASPYTEMNNAQFATGRHLEAPGFEAIDRRNAQPQLPETEPEHL
jgi:hypothetical protein